ncbi:hypothetical protein SKAU_G00153710 [Synaphobranchus kaupii]|uniref:Uncharacterized protein n=1 Tax=Synaphobranchus kaupii TaxID=118154 RepID=A0A9Q1IY56_SYNKA|nr:hypothetical protein SKAU_G00153710 [Synaphobranchus kaupii]
MEQGPSYKMSVFEGGSHVPLLMACPRVKAGLGVHQPREADIYPTTLGKRGKTVPHQPHGVELRADIRRAGLSVFRLTQGSASDRLISRSDLLAPRPRVALTGDLKERLAAGGVTAEGERGIQTSACQGEARAFVVAG